MALWLNKLSGLTDDEFQLRPHPVRRGAGGSGNRGDLPCAAGQVEPQSVRVGVDVDASLACRRGRGHGLAKQLAADALAHVRRMNPE